MPSVECGREEVVRGELRVVAPHRVRGAEIATRLACAFSLARDVAAYASRPGLLIERDPLTCLAPDVVVYWRERMVVDDHDVLCSPPDLIIEILSPSETKRRKQTKLDNYARIGVPEAWIVSPEAQHVEIWLLRDGKLIRERIVAEGNLQPTQFPGVSIPTAEI